MFDQIIEWLEKGGDAEYADRDVRTAVAAIYYHMMAVDGAVRLREIEAFTRILAVEFDLDDDQIHDLLHRGAESDQESPSLFPFATIINRSLDEDKRKAVLVNLADLADSDGFRHPLETDLLTHLADLLKVPRLVNGA